MILPLWSLLIVYGVILFIFVLFTLLNIVHILRYGFWNFPSALFVLTYLFLTAVLLLWTYQVLIEVDWFQPLYIIESIPNFQAGPSTIPLP